MNRREVKSKEKETEKKGKKEDAGGFPFTFILILDFLLVSKAPFSTHVGIKVNLNVPRLPLRGLFISLLTVIFCMCLFAGFISQ